MNELKKSILVSLWFMFLTFPIMVIRVNSIEKTVVWRWENMALIGIGSFVLSFVWRWALRRKEAGDAVAASGEKQSSKLSEFANNPALTTTFRAIFLVGFLVTPWLVTTYQTNILISFLLLSKDLSCFIKSSSNDSYDYFISCIRIYLSTKLNIC